MKVYILIRNESYTYSVVAVLATASAAAKVKSLVSRASPGETFEVREYEVETFGGDE